MGLANKRDTRIGFSAGRNRNQHSFRQVDQADRVNTSAVEADEARASRLTFIEDFMLEHCHRGLHIAILEVAGSYGTALKEPQQSAQAFGFPS
jgi:hypothetical protein